MKYIGEQESKVFSGFYHIPNMERYLINENGVVIDTVTSETLSVTYTEYQGVTIFGKTHHIHRLLAQTFLPAPDLPTATLDVNHMDGNKWNNALSNLEWITRSGNCLHAYRTGLRTDNTPILVKDLRDDSVTRYYSLQECARVFKTDGAVIFNHLRDKNRGKVSWNFYVLIREGGEWPEVDKSSIGKHRNGLPKHVFVTNVSTGKHVIYSSLSDAADDVGMKYQNIASHISRNKDKPYKGLVFRYMDDPSLRKEVSV